MRCAAVAVAALTGVATVPDNAHAVGVYEDAAGYVGFLFAPHRPALRAAVIRTNADPLDASMMAFAFTYPLRDHLLVGADVPFITVSEPGDMESRFGDLGLRARMRFAGGDGRAVHLLGGLRVGSGSSSLYPYSTQSYDVELGVGYVDSLGVLDLWASTSGVAVFRAPEELSDAQRHEDFARVDAGLAFPFGPVLALRLGATVLAFRSGAVRDLYLTQLQYRWSDALELRVSGHAEAGRSAERVSDVAITVGIHTFF